MELLAFLEYFAKPATHLLSKELQQDIKDVKLTKGFIAKPILFYRACKKVAQWFIYLGDWRILRIWHHVYYLVERETENATRKGDGSLLYEVCPFRPGILVN